MISFCFLFVAAVAVEYTPAQRPVVLYSPSNKAVNFRPTASDKRIVDRQLVPKARTRWAEIGQCDGSGVNVIGAADGSFTRAGAKQRVIVYELCQIGNGFANNGLAVVENGRVVAHFTESGGWDLQVSRVPDLNRNGRNEIAIEIGGGMHQGYEGGSITVLEVSEKAVKDFGSFLAYSNYCEELAPGKYCDRNYKLTAVAGARPSFFAQKFTNRGSETRPRWVAAGKPLRAKRLENTVTEFEAVK